MHHMAPSQPLSTTLIGTWELLSREDFTRNGERRIDPSLGADPIAILTYDRGGYFAAQFMKRKRGPEPETVTTSAAPNNSRARGGYDAYFGTYTVNDTDGTVTQRLTGALSPENVGQVLTRGMSVTGDELLIRVDTASADGEPIVRTLRWKRVA
ncbi:MAG TPA: lipocalin-like domain-containing protein [Gammaproteobacteria bacterium]|nr:lipocalin-like domain-containing protein [Gammaproteobacteria bacterium]